MRQWRFCNIFELKIRLDSRYSYNRISIEQKKFAKQIVELCKKWFGCLKKMFRFMFLFLFSLILIKKWRLNQKSNAEITQDDKQIAKICENRNSKTTTKKKMFRFIFLFLFSLILIKSEKRKKFYKIQKKNPKKNKYKQKKKIINLNIWKKSLIHIRSQFRPRYTRTAEAKSAFSYENTNKDKIIPFVFLLSKSLSNLLIPSLSNP